MHNNFGLGNFADFFLFCFLVLFTHKQQILLMESSTKAHLGDIIDTLREITRLNVEERTPFANLFRIHAPKLGLTDSALRGHWERLRDSHHLQIKAHGLQILSAHQIETLRYTCQAFSAANLPLRNLDIRLITRSLWDIDLNRWAVSRWLKTEKKNLSVRRCVGLTKNRMDVPKIQNDLKAFIDQVDDLHARIKFPANCFFNCDETRVSFKESGMEFRRIEWADREKHNLATSRQEKTATLLTFISADGNVFFSLWIFKTGEASQVDFRIMPAEKTRQDGWPRYYAFSESG